MSELDERIQRNGDARARRAIDRMRLADSQFTRDIREAIAMGDRRRQAWKRRRRWRAVFFWTLLLACIALIAWGIVTR